MTITDLKSELVKRLEKIPGVSHRPWPDRVDGFSAVLFREKEIAHFHNFRELDLRLGKALIKAEGLVPYPDSKTHPNRTANSQYIELRFSTKKDLANIVRLVKLAVGYRDAA